MTAIPHYGAQRGGFFRTLRADINKMHEPDNNLPVEAENAENTYKDSKDALGTKDYAESVKNLTLALTTMKPPETRRINAAIELKSEKIPESPEEDDLSYLFLDNPDEDFETSPDDYDETLVLEPKEEYIPKPKEMSLEKFLEETEGGEFDILPVMYNLNYCSNGAFMPEKIDKVVVPHPKSGDQIVLYTKDGKAAFIDFVTGRRIVQEPDEDGNYKTTLIDDDGYKFDEDTYLLYSPKKKFWQ